MDYVKKIRKGAVFYDGRNEGNMGERRIKRIRRTLVPMVCADSVILRGNEGATVYGCKKIVRYDRDRICLCIGARCVCVRGEDLICTSFSAGSVSVEGEISSVHFCPKGCIGTCESEGERR